MPPLPTKVVVEPVKPKAQLLRGVKGPLQKKPGGAAVKFSLASKANTIKRLNNPLLQLAEAEEENDDDGQPQLQLSSLPIASAMETSPVKTTNTDTTIKPNEEDNFLTNLPLPDGPARPKDIRISPIKLSKAPSPIFRPSTPPLLPTTSTYDPSFPTNDSSSSNSSPSLSASPLPPAAVHHHHVPPPPLPPPPKPPMMPVSFTPSRPLLSSLPPPPLPPPPLLAGSPVLIHRPTPGSGAGLLSGHFQHLTYPPPPIAGLHSGPPPPIPPSAVLHQHQVQGGAVAVAKVPIITSLPPPPVPVKSPVKSGRPMTPPSPALSDGCDIFGLSPDSPVSNHETSKPPPPSSSSKTRPSPQTKTSTSGSSSFDSLLQGSNHQPKQGHGHRSAPKPAPFKSNKSSPMKIKPGNGVPTAPTVTAGSLVTQEGIEECPSSAVELQVKEKVC